MSIDRLRREFEVDTEIGEPRVAHEETIRSPFEGEAKVVRQLGGRGVYAHVVLRVEPKRRRRIPPRPC